VGAVVFAAVARGGFVITHSSAHAGNFVGRHTGSDSSSVNDDTKVAGLGRNRSRNEVRVVRIVDRFSRVSSKILMIVAKFHQHALFFFFLSDPAVISAESDLLFIRRAAPSHSFELNASFADQVLRERSQQGGFIDPQRVTSVGLANLIFGDYLFASFV